MLNDDDRFLRSPPAPAPAWWMETRLERDGPRALAPPRTNWTRRVLHPVLIGHAASLTPYKSEPPGNLMGLALSPHGEKERSIRPITRYNYKEVWGGETAAREK